MFKKFYTVNLFKNMNTNSLFSENTMPDHCSVVGCTQIRGREDGIRFFRFPIKNKEQRESWLKAICRKSKGNKNWTPSKTAVVCSKHFVSGNPNPTRTHPDYTPSIFPTNHRNPSTTASLQRHSRVMKRTIVRKKFYHSRKRKFPDLRCFRKIPKSWFFSIGWTTVHKAKLKFNSLFFPAFSTSISISFI